MSDGITIERNVIVGLDLGDEYSSFCVLERGSGELMEEGRLRTTEAGVRRKFQGMERARVAIEIGTHSPWISDLLEALGHEVLVANPRRLRLIYENRHKTDKVDAEYLARLARVDPLLLSPIRHRGQQARADLAVLRSRDALVRSRTALVNHVRGAVKSFGSRLPKCSTNAFGMKLVDGIPEELRPGLVPILQTIDELSARIKDYDSYIDQLSTKSYPDAERVRQINGVGPLTALAFVLVLEDPNRFPTSRAVGPYLGLVPQTKNSGQSEPQLRITKQGDEFVRRLLVQSAQYILGPFGTDCDLRRFGEKLALRGGKAAKKRAVVAVARKLGVLMHALWQSGSEYDPFRNTPKTERAA